MRPDLLWQRPPDARPPTVHPRQDTGGTPGWPTRAPPPTGLPLRPRSWPRRCRHRRAPPGSWPPFPPLSTCSSTGTSWCCRSSPRTRCGSPPACGWPFRPARSPGVWSRAATSSVGGGRVRLPHRDVVAVRTWRPARVTAAAQPLDAAALARVDRSGGHRHGRRRPARADRRPHPYRPRHARPGRAAGPPHGRPRRRRARAHPERRRRPVRCPARPARGWRPRRGARGRQRRRDAVAGRHDEPVRLPAARRCRGLRGPRGRHPGERGVPGQTRPASTRRCRPSWRSGTAPAPTSSPASPAPSTP